MNKITLLGKNEKERAYASFVVRLGIYSLIALTRKDQKI